MNMMCDHQQYYHKWDTDLCLDIHKKIKDTVKESWYLVVGHLNKEQFEVLDHQRKSVNLQKRTCSCKRSEVYRLPCDHSCAAFM